MSLCYQVFVRRLVMNLRICTPSMPQYVDFREGQVTGILAPAYDLTLSVFKYSFPNLTINPTGKLGDLIDPEKGYYDGCIGQLQNNHSDTYIPITSFPLIAPGIDQGHVLLSSTIVIGTGYNSTAITSTTDVMDAFGSFSRSLWLMIVTTAVVFALSMFVILLASYQMAVLRIRKRLLSRKVVPLQKGAIIQLILQVIAITMGNMIKQHTGYNIKCRKMMVRMLVLSMAIFAFIISLYFSAMIKTEKVLVKRPDTISSYQEILDRPHVRPVWARPFGDHREFRDARPGSRRRRIWQRAQAMGINESFYDFNSESINKLAVDCIHRRSVWLGPAYLTSFTTTNGCAMMASIGMFSEINAWMKTDGKAEERLFGLMKSSLMPRDQSRLLDKAAQRALEHNLMDQVWKQLDFIFVKDGIGTRRVRECVANRIIEGDHVLTTPGLNHYRNLGKVTAVSLAFSALLLTLELLDRIFLSLRGKKKHKENCIWERRHQSRRNEGKMIVAAFRCNVRY